MEPDAHGPRPPGRGRAHLLVLAGCFVASGAASLMDQVVWLRYLGLIFGNTTWAAATLLAVFLGGLGLGALLVGRFGDRVARPLVVYAVLEVAIALLALASPQLLSWIDGAYVVVYRSWGNQPWLFALGRAALAAAFLLPPTLLMGGTLPLVIRGAGSLPGRVGRATALLYGANTVGAVAGTATSGFLLVPTIGLRATLLVAAALNLLAAVGALAVSRPVPAGVHATAVAPAGRRQRLLLALFFAMGATSLAYEVLWTRALVFYLGSSVYAFSLMLLVVLLGIAAGSLLVAPWADRLRPPLLALAVVELGIAAWIPVQVLLFGRLNTMLVGAAEAIGASTFHGMATAQLLAALPLLLPPTILMGMSFPLAVKALHGDPRLLGSDVGRVYGWNTLGSVCGSLAAGFVHSPALGTQRALLAVAGVNALLALALVQVVPSRRLRVAAWAVPALLVAAAFLLPRDLVILAAGMFRNDRPGDLVHFREDAQATVTIRRLDSSSGPYLSLELNGVNVAGTSPDLYAIQKLQGHLPLLLATEQRAVAHIGFGSGGTAWAVSRHPVDDILVVEISPQVLATSDQFFGPINHGVLDDPRVRVEINDGRNFLLASEQTFDAVLSDSIHPRYAGNGSLYTEEYFALLRERLRPGGVASMWLPMYSLTPRNFAMILRAFGEVFPHVQVWYEPSALNSFTVVTGSVDAPTWTAEALEGAFADPAISGELADIGLSRPADLLPLLLATEEELAPWMRVVPPHSDELPAVEYESGALLHKDLPWLGTFTRLLALRPDEPPAAWLAALPAGERDVATAAYRERRLLLERHREVLSAAITRELEQAGRGGGS
jgi:spermidine synthase